MASGTKGHRFIQAHELPYLISITSRIPILPGSVCYLFANGIQAANFLGDRLLRRYHSSAGIDELYRHSVNSAFLATEAFLVTGAPHASAYYPRDFAWFYPDVLDPDTIMDSRDAISRVRLLEKSVRLMLEAVRSNVVTTTIVPAGSDRYIGVNYFSLPSDTLLGILAGLDRFWARTKGRLRIWRCRKARMPAACCSPSIART